MAACIGQDDPLLLPEQAGGVMGEGGRYVAVGKIIVMPGQAGRDCAQPVLFGPERQFDRHLGGLGALAHGRVLLRQRPRLKVEHVQQKDAASGDDGQDQQKARRRYYKLLHSDPSLFPCAWRTSGALTLWDIGT